MKGNISNLSQNTSELDEVLIDGPNMDDICDWNGHNDSSDQYEYGH